MEFTYQAYRNVIQILQQQQRGFYTFQDNYPPTNAVILRHDLDFSIEMAMPFAELEHEVGVEATYFVLVTSVFYNANDIHNAARLKRIVSLGHTIGLHFDRTRYGKDFDCEHPDYVKRICDEAALLESIIERPVSCVSMHEPSAKELAAGITIPKLKNAYSKEFFEDFDYYSDSVMHWRQDVLKAIEEEMLHNIQILTHPFWYDTKQQDVKAMLLKFIYSGNVDRYTIMQDFCGYLDTYVSPDILEGVTKK